MITGDLYTYQLQIRGQVEAADIQSISPPGLVLEPAGEARTLLTFTTDQSGLVGLIRHLHGLGFVLLSIQCQEEKAI
jgi:hypothetical protein